MVRFLRAGLLVRPDFMRLWVGQTISLLGTQIGGGALRFTAIILLAATPVQLGLLTAAAMLPGLLLALPAGIIADRVRRRRLLVLADLGRALLLLSVPIAFALGALRVEQLYLVAALVGALAVLFDTTYPAYIPSVVGRDDLVEANSKLGVSDSLAEIAGPPLGGALVQALTAPVAIVLDALSFVASALAIGGVRAAEAPPAQAAAPDAWRELREGLAAIRERPALVVLLGVVLGQSLAGGAIGSLYDLYLLRDLGLTPLQVGVTIGAGGISALAGALVAQPVVARLGTRRTLVASAVLGTMISPVLPLASGPWAFWALVAMQAGDALGAIFAITALSLRQSVTPDHLLGRVTSGFGLLAAGAALTGALAGGALAQTAGVRAALACAVGIGTLTLLWLVSRGSRLPE